MTEREPDQRTDFQVAIVGAGPVGMTLALLLDKLGVSTVLLERATTITATPRAVGVDDMGLRTWQATGVLDDLLPDMVEVGHGGAGMVFHTQGRRQLSRWCPDTIRYGFSRGMTLNQPLVEARLREAVNDCAFVRLMTGHEVRSVADQDGKVRLEGARNGDEEFALTAFYAVGCDGGESLVRRTLGARMTGSYRSERWLILDVIDRDESERSSYDILIFGETPRAAVTVPRKAGHRRWEFQILPNETDEDLLNDETINRLIDQFGGDSQCEILRRVVYRFRSGNASKYGAGRLFVAGDAAHIMPPYAGQGLACGLHDAANLAWRLWLASMMNADARLLDDYDRERRPVSGTAIGLSVLNRNLVAPDTWFGRGLRDVGIAAIGLVPGGRRRLSQMQLRPFTRYRKGTRPSGLGHRRVGHILPQWRTRADGDHRALDDVLGYGFSLVGIGDVDWSACEAGALGFWQSLGASRVSIPATDFDSMSAEVQQLVRPLSGTITVVRPDRIIMAVCRPEELETTTERCRRALTVP